MPMQFDQRSPVYLQVIRWFKERIATEELERGQEIPSRREIAAQLGINPNTAQKAYKEMEEQHLITTERNVPSKITTDPEIVSKVRTELLNEAVEQFVHSIQAIQVPLEEVVTKIEHLYETKERGKIDA
ncbi:GntR family transcriptional regulator [Exiguobacterium sp. s193]|uniref:GntR family transcriptional regulator n=1 Tax=Exiguobacterium sp. s193 TaxID=2751207 RepID=UPI001BE9F5B6|nr:GntR family transcriptional regulator [Exiguobacterium sp. s193]